LQRRNSFDSLRSNRSQGPVAITFPSERGGRGGGGGESGGSGEGGAAGTPLERVEEPVDELCDELQLPRSPRSPTDEQRRTQSHAIPRVTLHRRSRSEPPRDLQAVRFAAINVLRVNSPAE